MKVNDMYREYALPADCGVEYAGIAFDGRKYYLPVKGREEIIIMDGVFRKECCVRTCRVYTAICYDLVEGCFWAAAAHCPGTIFQIDPCFQEIGRMEIPAVCGRKEIITGVAFCCCNNYLLVTAGNQILQVDKRCTRVTVLYQECRACFLTGIVCAFPLIIYYGVKDSRQFYTILSDCHCSLEEGNLPCDLWVEGALLYPCKDACGLFHLYQLATQFPCGSYLIDIRLGCLVSEKICSCNEALCSSCRSCKCCEQGKNCGGYMEPVPFGDFSGTAYDRLLVNKWGRKVSTYAAQFEQLLVDKIKTIGRRCGVYDEPPCPPPRGGCGRGRPCERNQSDKNDPPSFR